jgi:hypothetical protein
MRSAEKMFITKVLFIDWLQTQLIPKNYQLRIKAHYDGSIVLLIDGHASHITPRVVAYASSQQIILIRLVAYSSHIRQPLDLCVFPCSISSIREHKAHKLKGETLKIYRAILALYKATIIPMVRWSFLRAGFRLNPKNLLVALAVTRTEVGERIVVPELSLEEFIFSATGEAVRAAEKSACRRAPIPGPTEFAISLKGYVDKIAASCPLCGHMKVQGDREEGENT